MRTALRRFGFFLAAKQGANQLTPNRESNLLGLGLFQLVFILPAHNQLVVDRPNPVDSSQGFLRHLLFEETSHSSLKDHMPIFRPKKNLPLMEVGMANDYLAGKICQLGWV
jgi:hypothetical protein